MKRRAQFAKDAVHRSHVARRVSPRDGAALAHLQDAVGALADVVGEIIVEVNPYAGVDWGSDEAAEEAAAYPLARAEVEEIEATGHNGAILVGDVRDYIAALEGVQEDEKDEEEGAAE